MPYKRFLGYEKGEDGEPQIVESEAQIIRLIYRLFMEGKTSSAIAKYLTDQSILTPGGKDRWLPATVNSILKNEKYKGDALLQKKFTVDFLTKKMKVNEGEIPQYYVENSHPAIIDPEEFDAVQVEIARRKQLGRPSACQSPISTKLVCADCGGYFGSKVWSSNTKYRKTIWQCNDKYKGATKCTTPHVTEDEIQEKFVTAFNSILHYRQELIDNCRLAQKNLCDLSDIDKELDELHQEMEIVVISIVAKFFIEFSF
ncbi:recombinase family protein [Alkalibacter mobilis]|uniref:recombinase family protein n=1 Tax=Alkalibacter mobilis TaxID=2787712 RepID=UPI00189D376C|nr:recombinase family protein [Alkalibacter mobilis]MBF7097783.1 recombinase family protein [Alkalibacter mobilis]